MLWMSFLQVSIGGEGWTVNKVRFEYFANTFSKNCLAYGPGLLKKGVFGIEMPFIIQVCTTLLPLVESCAYLLPSS